MLGIFAKTFMNATRTEERQYWNAPDHWSDTERFSDRRGAELEAHLTARRRY